jgi:basic membrane lipoprotein Med (substrate-binding protein (PBP1-ABC) superfamily)
MLTCLAVVLAVGAVAGCGSSGSTGSTSSSSSSSSSSGGQAPAKQLKVTWLYTGPKNDGGFNVSQTPIMDAMGKMPGVSVSGIYNVPYSQQAASIVKQAIAGGANVIVDTLGLSQILSDVCKQAPNVKCYGSFDAAPQIANARAYGPADWNLGYLAGVAAGLMTKTGKIGFIGSYDVPLLRQGANAYTLGCQSVKPNCTVSSVYINAYFDPTKSAQASETLINSGVDVLRNWMDDPGFCQIAAKRNVYAVGNFFDFKSTCPKSTIMSTLWDMTNYFTGQAKKIQDDQFQSSGTTPDAIQVTGKTGDPRVGEWGDFVPASVRTKVEDIQKQMIAGKRFIVGPITDSKGKLRFKAGETVPDSFLFSKWTWTVKGLSVSK